MARDFDLDERGFHLLAVLGHSQQGGVGLPARFADGIQGGDEGAGRERGARKRGDGGRRAGYFVPGPALAGGGLAALAVGLLTAKRGTARSSARLFRTGWWLTVIGGAGVLYVSLWWAVSAALA